MTRLSFLLCALSALLLPVRPARAQSQTASDTISRALSTSGGSITTTVNPPLRTALVTGAPYSGQETFERSETLADGTHISEQRTTLYTYRDSAGRVRTERPLAAVFPGQTQTPDGPREIQITDPIEGVAYILDPQQHIAHRFQLLDPQARLASPPPGGTTIHTVAAPNSFRPPRPEMSSEDLGTQVMEGVPVVGTRTTQTFPAGMVGNDRPISTICERWTARDLHVLVLRACSDPRNGDTTNRLKNLSTAEPDPSLFQVPAGYQIVDETGPVTLRFTRP